MLERQLALDGAELERGLGHAVDDAARLVLADGLAPACAHRQQALGAVPAHAGEDDAERVAAGGVRDGVEQHVDRGAVAVDRLAVAQPAA